MKIKLGEAANCEHGSLGYESGHLKGNQTGQELRIIDYYNKPWVYVFRATDSNIQNALAIRMEQSCRNMAIGYGQLTRDSYRAELTKSSVAYDPSRITVLCDADCSSLVNTIAMVTWKSIGHDIGLTGSETTAEMPAKYKSMPKFFADVTSSVNLSTGAGLKRGDILVRPSTMGGGHTAMIVSVDEMSATRGTVTTTLCLRKKPVSGKVIKYMPSGASVEIVDSVIASNGAKWYKVIFEGSEGFCSARYVNII